MAARTPSSVRPPSGARTPFAARTLLVAAVVVQLVVLYAPRAPSTGGLPWLDEAVHVAVFGAVAWAGVRAGVRVRLLVGLLLAHAVVSEVLQHAVLPGRSGDPLDALADAAGTLAGTALGLGAAALARRRAGGGRLGRWRTSRASGAPAAGSTGGR